MSTSWTTVGKSKGCTSTRKTNMKTQNMKVTKTTTKATKTIKATKPTYYVEPEWMKRNRLAKEQHVNPITGKQFNTAKELANDLYETNYKTTQEAEFIAGIRNTLKCTKTGAVFTNEYKWRQHNVKNGICPIAYCRRDCGNSHGLVSHLTQKHHKQPEIARKMCFMKEGYKGQGFTAPVVKSNNPLNRLLRKEKKRAESIANARKQIKARY
jgi:hypothetical protein